MEHSDTDRRHGSDPFFTEGNAFVFDCKLFPVADGGEIRNSFVYSSFDNCNFH